MTTFSLSEQSQAELRAQRLAQEEAERLAQEEARRLIQEAEQRAKEAERLAKEKTERLAREQAEQRAREEAVLEAQRRAQEEAQQALAIAAAFQAYDNKWNLLSKLANELSSIYFWDIPWPVFHPVTHPSQLTGDAVKQFLFWPGRPGTEDKTPRGILKNELLKWHEDKFKNTTVKRVVENEQEMAAEAGKIVNIILSNLLEEASANN